MIEFSVLPRLEKILGHGKVVTSGELQFNCPFCLKRTGREDTKHHLYINPNKVLHDIKGWYFCQRCLARGPLKFILDDVESVVISDSILTRWDEFLNSLKSAVKFTTQDIERRAEVKLPEDYIPCFKGTEAYDYLEKRNISESIIEDYRIGFGTQDMRNLTQEEKKKYAGSGRIIFPDYDSLGNLVHWVARTYKNHKVKYRNPFGSSRDTVYNLARAQLYDEVIVTEGVISAISAGRNAVATYGKSVTTAQISLMASVKFKRYIVALDGDAVKRYTKSRAIPSALKLSNDLYKRGLKVFIVKLPYEHDPASIPDFEQYLNSAQLYNLSTMVDLLSSASRW